jgi:hypothetical protein
MRKWMVRAHTADITNRALRMPMPLSYNISIELFVN